MSFSYHAFYGKEQTWMILWLDHVKVLATIYHYISSEKFADNDKWPLILYFMSALAHEG
jgi:hypothetical protein